MNRLRVVLDTNALLVSIAKKSKYRPIFEAILTAKIELVITNDILLEYVEIIERKANQNVATNIAEMLMQRKNVVKIGTYYKWQLITQDPDDNKFVDCAIAGKAHYVVTNDRHFSILKQVVFPKVRLISIENFLEEVNHLNPKMELWYANQGDIVAIRLSD